MDLQLCNSKGVVLRLEVITPVFTLTSSYLVILKELVEFQVAKMKQFELLSKASEIVHVRFLRLELCPSQWEEIIADLMSTLTLKRSFASNLG